MAQQPPATTTPPETTPESRSRLALREVSLLFAVALAYYVVGRLGLELALVETNVTPLWPASGIAVAALFSLGRRAWPAIAIAAFLVNAPMSGTLVAAAAIAAGNTFAPLLAAWLLHELDFDARLGRRRDALTIVLCALAGMLVSATIGSLTLVVSGVIDGEEFLSAWSVWWAGDAMGVLAVAPFLWTLRSLRPLPRVEPWQVVEAVASLAALVAVTWWTLRSTTPLLFVILPMVAWVAWRFQQAGAAPAALIVLTGAAWAAAERVGPFAGDSLPEMMMTLQAFNASVALASFYFAAVVTEQRRATDALAGSRLRLQGQVSATAAEWRQAEVALRESEAAFRAVFEKAPTGLVQAYPGGRIVRANPAFQRMAGYRAEELREMRLQAVMHPADARSGGERLAQLEGGVQESVEFEARYQRKDGSWFWALTSASLATEAKPLFIHAVVQDLTERKQAEALARADAERQRLEEIFVRAPAAVVLTRGPDHVVDFANPVFLDTVDAGPDCIGKPARAAFPDRGPAYFDLLDRVFQRGEPSSADEAPLRGGTGSSEAYFNFVYQPLRDETGAVTGIFGHELEVTDMVLARREVEALAEQLARLYDREHQVAATLQRSLLPERLPVVDGTSFAARYVAGSREADVGGDWYDAVSVPDGRVMLVIGDVEGRGVGAAATMGQLRNALRTYAFEGAMPGEALGRLSRLIESSGEERFATVLCLLFSPLDGRIYYANAGHLPALIVRSNGTTTFLDQALSPPVGISLETPCPEGRTVIEPGSTLVLYTDGLVERRGVALDQGLQWLAGAAGQPGQDAEGMVTTIIDELGRSERDDDIAVLAVHRQPPSARYVRIRLPAEPRSVQALRRQLRSFLVPLELTTSELHDILLAVSEAATNAIEHPCDRADEAFEVDAQITDGGLLVIVRDFGHWRMPAEETERGRGIQLMGTLMQLEIDPGPTGTEVRLRTRPNQR